MRTALAVFGAALTFASPGVAQDATTVDGWDVVDRDGQRMAGVSFSSGVSLVFRCGPNPVGIPYFQAFVTGLPEAEGQRRVLEISRPGGQMEPQTWTIATTPTIALSPDSARLARGARLGGPFSIRLPGDGDAPAREYRMELPTDAAGVDAALTACGAPLVDEADAVQPAHTIPGNGLYWSARPMPHYPERAVARGIKAGRVELSCEVNAEGRTANCRIVSEDPPGVGFGQEALAAARRATVDVPASRPAENGRITFPITFRIF